MDESPITKLVEHATAAHAAVTAQRAAARETAQRAESERNQATQTQEGTGSGQSQGY